MSDPTHLITLQRTLDMHIQEQLRVKSELETHERNAARCREQLQSSERIIDQASAELQAAIEIARNQVSGPYDPRGRDGRGNDRYQQPRYDQSPRDARYDQPSRETRYDQPSREPRYDQPSRDPRYDQPARDNRYDHGAREPRYSARDDERYNQRYDRSNYRDLEPPSYQSPAPAPLRPRDIDEEVAHLHRDEQGSNVRFADFRIPQAATIVLREANEPLHVSEIFRRMAQGGFEFRGQHQQITLAVSLTRSNRFRKVAPGTFELEPAYRNGQVA